MVVRPVSALSVHFDDEDRWADEYQMRAALKKALETKESEEFLKQLTDLALPPQPSPEQRLASEPVSAYFADKLQGLRQRIEGLRQELNVRRDLRRRFLQELDYQITVAALSLKEFQFWGIGYNRGVDMKRSLLERQLADFRQKRRQEELRFWGDAVTLRKDLRNVLAEYQDALRRARLIEDTG